MPASAPFDSPSSRMPPSPGARRQRGGLEVVVQRVREQARVAGAQRLQHRRVDASAARSTGTMRGAAAVAAPVELAVHAGRREAELGDGEHPVERPRRERGAQPVAAAGADRGAARQANGTSAPSFAASACSSSLRERRAPQRVARDEGRRGIRGARRPCRRRWARACRSRGARRRARPAVRASSFAARIARFEASVGQARRVDAAVERDAELVVGPRPHVLVERHRLVRRGDVVVPVGLHRRRRA